jgi:hypothetical protein
MTDSTPYRAAVGASLAACCWIPTGPTPAARAPRASVGPPPSRRHRALPPAGRRGASSAARCSAAAGAGTETAATRPEGGLAGGLPEGVPEARQQSQARRSDQCQAEQPPGAPDDAVKPSASGAVTSQPHTCLWCGQPMPRGRRHGSARRFCQAKHRTAFHSFARRYVNEAISSGRLTVADLHGPSKACTPQSGAIWGRAATGVAKTDRPHPGSAVRVLWAEPPVGAT